MHTVPGETAGPSDRNRRKHGAPNALSIKDLRLLVVRRIPRTLASRPIRAILEAEITSAPPSIRSGRVTEGSRGKREHLDLVEVHRGFPPRNGPRPTADAFPMRAAFRSPAPRSTPSGKPSASNPTRTRTFRPPGGSCRDRAGRFGSSSGRQALDHPRGASCRCTNSRGEIRPVHPHAPGHPDASVAPRWSRPTPALRFPPLRPRSWCSRPRPIAPSRLRSPSNRPLNS